MRIDSHQHFWHFNPARDSWITEEMTVLRKDFMPEGLFPLLQKNQVDGCVAVQADQSLEETNFLLKLSGENPFIKGVVGWVDLQAPDIKYQLEHFSSYKKLKGFRHIVQSETDENFLLREAFCRGISALKEFNFTYDILVYSHQLKSVLQFIQLFPDQSFVIDHMGKPDIENKKSWDWENDMKKIASHPNVFCKISGLVTEAEPESWDIRDFSPYIQFVLKQFGTDRVMFGSDWPVCLLAANYTEVCNIVEENTTHLSPEDKQKLWGQNAIRFYGLE